MTASRLAVISYAAHDPFSPRATRTRAVIETLERDWSVELHASSTQLRVTSQRRRSVRNTRQALRTVSERILLDKYEGWSRRHFRGWEPEVEGALLIGLPASPLVYAAARLRARNIRYVMDVGDPWVLTHPDPVLRWPALARATHAEQRLWSRASGAVVTTETQARAISSLYPMMPILVRPNGYEETGQFSTLIQESADQRTQPSETLSLVHFGDLYAVRVDVGALLRNLIDSGRWREVVFAQYGSDWSGALDSVPSQARVTRNAPVPWEKAIAIARTHDAAIVVGNQNSFQLPSKAVQYLTLPIPRIALTSQKDDALAHYVASRPGWLAVTADDLRLTERVAEHIAHRWSVAELSPPSDEAWPRVAEQIVEFINRTLTTDWPSSGPQTREEASSRVDPLRH